MAEELLLYLTKPQSFLMVGEPQYPRVPVTLSATQRIFCTHQWRLLLCHRDSRRCHIPWKHRQFGLCTGAGSGKSDFWIVQKLKALVWHLVMPSSSGEETRRFGRWSRTRILSLAEMEGKGFHSMRSFHSVGATDIQPGELFYFYCSESTHCLINRALLQLKCLKRCEQSLAHRRV